MAEFVRFDFPLPEDEFVHRIWHQISTIRHDVYADELHQYDSNVDGVLEDPGRHFIACVEGDDLVGYISLNPPEEPAVPVDDLFLQRRARTNGVCRLH